MDAGLQRYNAFLDKMKTSDSKQVMIVGDRIEDTYVHCSMTRIAPEGEAPVLEKHGLFTVPGGAANVNEQIRQWNVRPIPVYGTATHKKTRYLVNNKLHMVLSEDNYGDPIDKESLRKMLAAYTLDAIIAADYGKGAITSEIARILCDYSKAAAVPLIVDPSPSPYSDQDRRWEGASVIKMNMQQWLRRIPMARSEWLDIRRSDALVITKGGHPPDVTVVNHRFKVDAFSNCVARRRLPVVDCSGAGDHFSAVLAAGMAHGLQVAEAAEFAHEASRLRVAYRRPRPILPTEVRTVFDPPLGKILTAGQVAMVVPPGARVVFTNGVFSMLHAGHSTMLDFAKSQGDVLIVGVNSDLSAAKAKGTMPLMPEEHRARLVASHSAVDYVVIFDSLTPETIMAQLPPIETLVKGHDHQGEDIPGSDLAGRVAFAPIVYPQHCSDWFSKAAESR